MDTEPDCVTIGESDAFTIALCNGVPYAYGHPDSHGDPDRHADADANQYPDADSQAG